MHKLSIEDSARLLGVSTRTLRTYIKQGFLSTSRGARNAKWLDPVEVETFGRERVSSVGKVWDRKDFMEMRARLTRLEQEVGVLNRILDTREQPLRMGPAYAKDLHAACGLQLASGVPSKVEIDSWTEIFLRIDEQDFAVIADVTGDRKPWVLYLRLCVSMTAAVVSDKAYMSSLDLQSTHKKLAEGRRRLRISGLCHLELTGSADADVRRHLLASNPASVLDSIEAVLKRKVGSTP